MKLSDKIYNLRKDHNMSQEELADKLHTSRQAVSRWECGSATPDAGNIVSICKLFDVSADYLLNEEYEMDEDIPAVRRNQAAMQAEYKKRTRRRIGWILIAAGVIGIIILGILYSVNPHDFSAYTVYGTEYGGFFAYLSNKNLRWLFILLAAAAIGGAVTVRKQK